jgi:DNA polymerase II large subunit
LTDATVETITAVEMVESDSRYVYNLTVDETHTLFADGFAVKQCDGDEDAVMLLMDGLLNFSKEYLPSARGKRTMDAPLVVSTVLDPLEVDDEAHNVDIVSQYPKEFYEATYRFPGPKDVDIPIAEDITDTGMGFNHTLETSLIHSGPKQSAYKSIQGMDNKTDAQLKIARITRAVDEDSVALKVIEKHYMPDIIGNLSAFARQSVRCPKCNEKYRRAPLLSECTGCGVKNSIILTVHEGSVKKYIDIVTRLSDEYDVGEYTRQRITALSERIDSLFEDDHNKQTDLGRFF